MRQLSLVVSFIVVVLFVAISACSSPEPRAGFEVDGGTMTNGDGTEPPPTGAGDPKKPPASGNPDEAAAPEVDAITPNKATVGSVGPSIIVSGNNFVPRSIVQLDGAALATSFVSGTELRATIPSGKLATTGTLRISVGTAPPGGGASKEVTFTVENPEPKLTALAPLSVIAGSGATNLEVTGSSFVSDAKITFGTTPLATTFVSATQLKATIPASALATSGSIPVSVTNPGPGGGTSPTTISFTVSNPSANIQTINPSAAFVGSAPFEMTVEGSGFVSGSTILFNGTGATTTFVSGQQLKAQIPASALGAAGDFPVAVQNPPPGGGVSAPVVFRVQYPAPSANTLSPNTASAGSNPTQVTVTGVGFFPATQITFDGAPAATTFVDSTHVRATLTASQLAAAGSILVRVVNPQPGGGTSGALAFTTTNGMPTITSLSPSTVTTGSPDRMITVYGTAFTGASTIRVNGQSLSTSYLNGGALQAIVPANYFLNAGTVAITVTNPPPGGGTSVAANITVGCDTTGVTVQLGAKGTTHSLNTNFNGTGMMSRWSAAGSCTSAPLNASNQQPGRYAIVQNTAGVPVTLSAWADCTNDGKGDAYLTLYKRPTIPANDNERLGCAYWVSEGTNGAGGFSSPDHGGSAYCPGLTKANGGGLQLGVCEKAVVHIQPYSYTSTAYTPPPTVKVRPE